MENFAQRSFSVDRIILKFFKKSRSATINISSEAIMIKIKFSELSFPKALNLHLLSEIITEKALTKLIQENAMKDRKQRRIMLPSYSCLRKVIIYFLMEKYGRDYSQVMEKLKGSGTMGSQTLQKSNILKLYETRKREIENE